MEVSEQELKNLEDINTAARQAEKEAYKAADVVEDKMYAADRAYRKAHGYYDGTAYMVKDVNGIYSYYETLKQNPNIYAQYGFSASDFNNLRDLNRKANMARMKHNATSNKYFAAKEQFDIEEEEKRKSRIAQKMEQSKSANMQATQNPHNVSPPAPTAPAAHPNVSTSAPKPVTEKKTTGVVGDDNKVHQHTYTKTNKYTGATEVIDSDTSEIIRIDKLPKAQEDAWRKKVSDQQDKEWKEKQKADEATRKAKAAEEKKQRDAQKEAERQEKAKQREEQKAQDKIRRQEGHERREKEREQNKKEYNEALDKYKKERAEKKAKEKQEREEAAKKRQEEYVKQRDAKSKEGEETGKNAYKQINDYTYTQKENYRQQVKDGGYKGTTADAKADLKNTLSDLWNMGTGDARKELSGAYKDISPSIDVFKNARSTVQGLYKNTVIGGVTEMAGNAQMALSAGALAAVDKDGMVNLQKIILSQKLADRAVLDNIMDAVNGQMQTFKDAGSAIKNAFLVQQAYVTAYVKQTFGNPQFMKNVTGVVAIKVGNYVEAWTNEQVNKYMNKANEKIDKVFTRVDQKIDKISSKIDGALDKVDKLTQIDLLGKMNDKIDKFTSLQGLQNKLNKSPLGALLSPIVGTVGSVGGVAIKGMFAQTGITSAVSKIQEKMVGLHDKIVKAKEFVQQKVQMVKNYINDLKEKAKAIVTDFANKIVGDIKSKIQNAVAGAIGGGFKL